MNRHELAIRMFSGRGGLLAAALREILTIPACVHAILMTARRRAYRIGLLPAIRAAKPVICVGNITTGGTGKTPMVAWMVDLLKGRNLKPAILTRGYKSSAGASDEAELLKAACGAAVYVGTDRAASASQAVADGADVLVMDDGFQHLRLARDLDIVLIDATNPFGFGRPLPAGLLRELPREALADADALVVTRSDQIAPDRLHKLIRRLTCLAPNASIHQAVHKPVAIVDQAGRPENPENLRGRKILAFCGLGNPDAFFHTVARLGAPPIQTLAFGDHCPYDPDHLARIKSLAGQCKPDLLLTTQKDLIKLKNADVGTSLAALKIQIDLTSGRAELESKILAASRRRS
ncbi:MAG: tetraacyldisaccharide 4'-kinase [Planctomycetes bacterium]|nr:tetraacyldisaccharide 4'-kinase [Planctomycetota bacterium]